VGYSGSGKAAGESHDRRRSRKSTGGKHNEGLVSVLWSARAFVRFVAGSSLVCLRKGTEDSGGKFEKMRLLVVSHPLAASPLRWIR
jgi:hypothetical protein